MRSGAYLSVIGEAGERLVERLGGTAPGEDDACGALSSVLATGKSARWQNSLRNRLREGAGDRGLSGSLPKDFQPTSSLSSETSLKVYQNAGIQRVYRPRATKGESLRDVSPRVCPDTLAYKVALVGQTRLHIRYTRDVRLRPTEMGQFVARGPNDLCVLAKR